MRISNVLLQKIPPLMAPASFNISKYVTIVRGGNGAGKTTLLEAIELLGHCSVLPREKADFDDEYPHISYQLVLSEVDIEFLNEILRSSNDLASQYDDLGPQASLMEVFNAYRSGRCTQFEIVFQSRHNPVRDLKQDFKDERKLEDHWYICCPTEWDRSVAGLLKFLIGYSRPKQNGNRIEDNFSVPDRIHALTTKQGLSSLPGIISYINTDMYEWGIGLDIRESPKDVGTDMPAQIEDRLHIIDRGDRRIVGYPKVRPVRNFTKICELWNRIYSRSAAQQQGDGVARPQTGELLIIGINDDDKTCGPKHDKPCGIVKIRVKGQENPRDFLSSGENQILFMGFMTISLEARGSIFLLDEPEIHLEIPAATKLYNFLANFAVDHDSQFVIVTHSPYAYSGFLCEKFDKESNDWTSVDPNRLSLVGLIFIEDGQPLYQEKALDKIGEAHNAELRAIEMQMRVPDEQLRTWRSVGKEFIEMLRLGEIRQALQTRFRVRL